MKIYNSDNWFYKLGIVGFDMIMGFNKDYFDLNLDDYNYNLTDDYIEFNKDLLYKFPECYYNYFINEYNTANNVEDKLNHAFNEVKDKDKFKEGLKEIKKVVKDRNAKIEKLNVDEFSKCKEIKEELDKVKFEDTEKIEGLIKDYIEISKMDKINKPITATFFKYVLANSFFGQVSFLNVCNNKKSLKEQQEIIFKDYVQPVIDSEDLKTVVLSKDEDSLRKFTENRTKDIESMSASKRSDVEKVIKDINGKLFGKKRKAKSASEILDQYNKCNLCEENISYGSDYTDGNFIPLAISNANSKNLFWNFNDKYPICPLCRLVLLCTAAGCARIFKSYLDDKYEYKDKLYYGFISCEGNLKDLIAQNNYFKNMTQHNASFEEYILNYVKQQKQISIWQLQNTLYVEFNADYLSRNSKLNYFDIPTYLAEFLIKHSDELDNIKDYREKRKVFSAILKRQNLNTLIDSELRQSLQGNKYADLYTKKVIILNSYLRQYKKKFEGGLETVDDKAKKSLNFIFAQGLDIAKYYRGIGAENKLPGICYRLLNATKAGNRNDLMDSIIRIYMSTSKEIPFLFLDIIKESEMDFEDIAHSFIAGLNAKERKNEEDK